MSHSTYFGEEPFQAINCAGIGNQTLWQIEKNHRIIKIVIIMSLIKPKFELATSCVMCLNVFRDVSVDRRLCGRLFHANDWNQCMSHYGLFNDVS